jgi:hypothetical protein
VPWSIYQIRDFTLSDNFPNGRRISQELENNRIGY